MPHGTGKPLGRFTAVIPSKARQSARRVATALTRAQTILVAGHAGADGDVVGSSLALTNLLREMGKSVTVYNELPYPSIYSWLPGADTVTNTIGEDVAFDATVAVDAADAKRCGVHFPGVERRGKFVWIDHHAHKRPPGDINYIDLTAASVGEQIMSVADALKHPISLEVAKCIYTSLMSDTGVFRYGNTSARAFRLAGRLVECGVDPWEMTQRIYESQDEARMRLLGRTLENMWVSKDGRFGIGVIRAQDMVQVKAQQEHIHGIVNHIRGIRGVELAYVIHEDGERSRVISRSRGFLSCESVAETFGAAGFKNAATFHVDGTVENVKKKLIKSLAKIFA